MALPAFGAMEAGGFRSTTATAAARLACTAGCGCVAAPVRVGGGLLSGAGLSLALTRKLGARPWAALWPQCAAICGLTAELSWLLL